MALNVLKLHPEVRVQYLVDRTAFRTRLNALQRDFLTTLHPRIFLPETHELDGAVELSVYYVPMRRYGMQVIVTPQVLTDFGNALIERVLRESHFRTAKASKLDTGSHWLFRPDQDYYVALENEVYKQAVDRVGKKLAEDLRQSDRLTPQRTERNPDR